MKLLQTTIAGSLPKPAWLAAPKQLWAPWLLEGERLEEGKRDAVRLALTTRNRPASTSSPTASRRAGISSRPSSRVSKASISQNKKTVRIRNRYDAEVPVVVGAVARTRSAFGEDMKFLRGETSRPVKFTLPGPMTMVDTLYDAHYKSREKLAMAFAAILNAEARDLEAAGADVIQFDEPAFNVYFDEVRDWGMATLMRACEGLRAKTAVHICYGYGIKANIDWKKTLGSEWRQYEQTFPLLAGSSIDQVSLECANSKVPLELLALLQGKDVLAGAIDVANEAVETPEEVAAYIRAALEHVAPEKLYPCTNCGMVPLSREVSQRKLRALAAGAAIVRQELGNRH